MNNQQEKTLLPSDVRALKRFSHHLKPVVLVGKRGISKGLMSEINLTLAAHELIKVQIDPKIKETWANDLQEIVRETRAQHIDTIGNIVILFRKNSLNSRYDF